MNQRKYWVGLLLPVALVCTCNIAAQSAHAATPLPLGSLTNVTSVTCPSGVAQGATCKHFTVTGCKTASGAALPNLGVTIAITTVSSPKGTIILQAGGGGTSIFGTNSYNFDFPDYYVGQGYNVVQTQYDTGDGDGWQSNDSGVLHEACRPATVFQYIYNNTAAHKAGTAFCGQGISGGGATFAYALAHYANNISGHTNETQQYLFDYVLMASGPSVNRLDVACDPSQVYNNANIVNCGITSYANSSLGSPVYGFGAGNPVNKWEGTSTCGSGSASQTDINTWAGDSIISTGPNAHTGVFSYGATNVSFYFCGVTNNNESLGLGWFLTQQIMPLNKTGQGLAPVNCFTQCTGESVWSDSNAVNQTKSDMLKYCVLNQHT